jgi:hypothetical protein
MPEGYQQQVCGVRVSVGGGFAAASDREGPPDADRLLCGRPDRAPSLRGARWRRGAESVGGGLIRSAGHRVTTDATVRATVPGHLSGEFASALGALPVERHPANEQAGDREWHRPGDAEGGARRCRLDNHDSRRRFGEVGHAPDGRDDSEGATEAGISPQVTELPSLGCTRSLELQGEAEYQGSSRPQRHQAKNAEYPCWYRAREGDSESGERVGHKRRGDAEHRDRGQRLHPAAVDVGGRLLGRAGLADRRTSRCLENSPVAGMTPASRRTLPGVPVEVPL